MTYTAYFLKFHTPLHIGDYKPDSYENSEIILRSDTLQAAIYAAWAECGKTELIPEDGISPFVLTSAFPFYYKGNEPVCFFPRAKVPFALSGYDPAIAKKIKKIEWLDGVYFDKFLSGQPFDETFIKDLQGVFLSKTKLPDDGVFVREMTERVKMPRMRSDESQSEPYYVERIRFNNGGLFFLAEGEKFELIDIALQHLAETGFGTDKSTGNGAFTFEKKSISVALPDDSDYSTNMGLYCPNDKQTIDRQLNSPACGYDIIKRGGWITTPGFQTLEKSSVYMFTEGSVFHEKSSVAGNPAINLAPTSLNEGKIFPHPVWRSGRTIFFPIKINR